MDFSVCEPTPARGQDSPEYWSVYISTLILLVCVRVCVCARVCVGVRGTASRGRVTFLWCRTYCSVKGSCFNQVDHPSRDGLDYCVIGHQLLCMDLFNNVLLFY